MIYVIIMISFDLRVGPILTSASMSQYNMFVDDQNAYYEKTEWAANPEKPAYLGRMPHWNKAYGLFYPELLFLHRAGEDIEKEIMKGRPVPKGFEITHGFGIGTNPIWSSSHFRRNEKFWIEDTTVARWIIGEHNLYVLPAILSYHLNFATEKISFLTRVGIGWYPSKLSSRLDFFIEKEVPGTDYRKTSTAKVKFNLLSFSGYGLDGSIAVGYSPSKFVTFAIGLLGRYVKISDYRGRYEVKGTEISDSFDCILAYHWDEYSFIHWWWPVRISDFNRGGYDKGEVELTGYGSFLQIILRF